MRYTSSDGALSSNDPQAVAQWERIGSDMRRDIEGWTERLRGLGVKLAHPDDGWVNRERNIVSPSYAQFDDGPTAGDLIALGYGYSKHWDGDFNYRLCRVTKVEEWGIISRSKRYHFDDTGDRL